MISNIIKDLLHDELQAVKQELLQEIRKSKEGPRYLTRKEVAQYLSCGLSTVDYWSRIGKLNKIHIDGTVRFDKQEIIHLLKSSPME